MVIPKAQSFAKNFGLYGCMATKFDVLEDHHRAPCDILRSIWIYSKLFDMVWTYYAIPSKIDPSWYIELAFSCVFIHIAWQKFHWCSCARRTHWLHSCALRFKRCCGMCVACLSVFWTSTLPSAKPCSWGLSAPIAPIKFVPPSVSKIHFILLHALGLFMQIKGDSKKIEVVANEDHCAPGDVSWLAPHRKLQWSNALFWCLLYLSYFK